ncbi:hypothetical protein MMC10_002982 [Thelotrema lepadinum]|nr:hypothetical protein [Thelotrema lepadinum]
MSAPPFAFKPPMTVGPQATPPTLPYTPPPSQFAFGTPYMGGMEAVATPLKRVALKSEKELLKMVNICNASQNVYKSSSKARFWAHINTELQQELRKPKPFTNCRGKMVELIRQRKTKEKSAAWINTTSESDMNAALDRWIKFVDEQEVKRGSMNTPERTAEAQLEEEMGAEDRLRRALQSDVNHTEPETNNTPNTERPIGANHENNAIAIDDSNEESRRTPVSNSTQIDQRNKLRFANYESRSSSSMNQSPMHPPPRPPPPTSRPPKTHAPGAVSNEVIFREMMDHLKDDGKAWREYMTWREYMMTSREQMANGAQGVHNAILHEVHLLRQQIAEDARARDNQRTTDLNLLNQIADLARAQDLQQRAISQALVGINAALAEMNSRQRQNSDNTTTDEHE